MLRLATDYHVSFCSTAAPTILGTHDLSNTNKICDRQALYILEIYSENDS